LEIEEVIFDLKNSESMGVDGIRLSLMKHCMADVVPSIVKILYMSFETAVSPANMKKSRVVPVFKSGDRTDPNNYRPIFVKTIHRKKSVLLSQQFKKKTRDSH
jgi:hypothetical protein